MSKIICTTADEVAGHRVNTTLGVVVGEHYVGKGSPEEAVEYERAMKTMANEAELLGADAVVGVRLTPVVSDKIAGIFAYGTAVKLARPRRTL